MRQNFVEVLGKQIGPRMAGSPEARLASEAIGAALEDLGLDVQFQEFEFLGYVPDEPSLEVDGVPWPVGPCLYSSHGNVEGTVQYTGTYNDGVQEFLAFAIEDHKGNEVARLYAAPWEAGAVPLGSVYGPILAGPSAIVSSRDGQRLRELNGAHTRLRTGGTLVPRQRDRNVVGYLPGEFDESVVVSSHFDSVWRGPGVIDNATGVEGMLRVIERLRDRPRRRGLLVCSFAGEEMGLLGSRFFVTDAKIRGRLDSIVGAVNLDAIAHGECLEVSVAPEELEGRLFSYLVELGVFDLYPIVIREPLPDADDYYFAQEGIPTISFVHFPYPEYHSTEERLDLVDERRLEDTVDLATKLVETQLEFPVSRTPRTPVRRRVVPR